MRFEGRDAQVRRNTFPQIRHTTCELPAVWLHNACGGADLMIVYAWIATELVVRNDGQAADA